jgi:glycosyltransferase involved in cell wall biosynthesis
LPFRLFLDVTSTYNSGLMTGIQRVVRSLAKELSGLAPDHEVEVILITFDPHNPRKVNRLSPAQLAQHFDPMNVAPSTNAFYKSSFFLFPKKLFYLTKRFIPQRVLGSYFFKSSVRKSVDFLFLALNFQRSLSKPQRVRFREGDVLLLVDAFWSTPNILPSTMEAKNCGAKIAVLIHDIIPITHPEFVDLSFAKKFSEMLPDLLLLADMLLYPSFYTREQLVSRFFPDDISIPNKRILWGVSKSRENSTLRNLSRMPNSIVMVGTVEPRKNHLLVLDWYLRLAPDKTKLTVIGKNSWIDSDLITALRRESQRDSGLTWIEDASDYDLDYEMSRHAIGLMASHVEGFGLPVLEYSAKGLRLVLSDIPVFRELASDSADYFDSKSIESLDQAIDRALIKKSVSSVPEVLWKDTALDILIFIKKELF